MKGIVGEDLEKYIDRVFDTDTSRAWSVADVQRLVDNLARLDGEVRVPHEQTVRIKLQELVRNRTLYSRYGDRDETNPYAHGGSGMKLYARVEPVPRATWDDRQALLKDVPATREYPSRVGTRRVTPRRPPTTETEISPSGDQDVSARVSAQDFPRRADIICTMIRELVKDLDGTTVTRYRLTQLETYSNWQTGEIVRLKERNARLEKQIRNVERARKLLETPTE